MKAYFLIAILAIAVNCTHNDIPRIAIVGAGMSGAALSHYLVDSFKDKVNVTVFEKTSVPGGKIRSERVDERMIEVGIEAVRDWHSDVKELVKLYDLSLKEFVNPGGFGIFDGKDITFNATMKDVVEKLRKRYGESFDTTVKLLKKFQVDFQPIYDVVSHYPKTSVIEVLKATTVDPLLLVHKIEDYFHGKQISKEFLDEFVRSIIYSFEYMSASEIHAYAGVNSLFSHFTKRFTVEEGLEELVKRMFKKLSPTVSLRLDVSVVSISFLRCDRTGKPQFEVSSKCTKTGTVTREIFDKVVISSVLQDQYPITFESIEIDRKNIFSKDKMVDVFSTVVIGNLNREFFHSSSIEELPEVILANDIKGFHTFNNIVNICRDCYKPSGSDEHRRSVYKIHAPSDITESDLKRLFVDGFVLKKDLTMRYRVIRKVPLPSFSDLPDIYLDKRGLYYSAAFEYLHSNIEYSTISARNIAGLIVKDITKEREHNYLQIDL